MQPGPAGKRLRAPSPSPAPPRLAIVFTTDAYPPQAVLEAVRRETGDSKLVGFCCGGILADDAWHPQGVGICTLGGDLRVRTTLQRGLDRDPYETGCRTADALLANGVAKGTVIVLPDGFEGTPLRKDFQLAARASKTWPGGKEPGEGHDSMKSPSRRRVQAPGVPPPEWGPR